MNRKVILMLLMVAPAWLFADVQFTVGGATRAHLIPSIMVHSYNYYGGESQRTFGGLGFGLNEEAAVSAVYVLSNDWAIGGSVLLGAGFLVGPFVFDRYNNVNREVENGSIIGYYSFNILSNFMAKTPPLKNDIRVVLEGGLNFRSGSYVLAGSHFNSFDLLGRAGVITFGPGIFVGGEKLFFNDNVSVVLGGRLSVDVANLSYYYYFIGNNYLTLVNFGLEVRVSWFKLFETRDKK